MNNEQLQRGIEIQDLLRALKGQHERLQRPSVELLRELTNNCSGRVDPELQDLEDNLRAVAIKNVKTRIDALEKEFKKL